MLVPIDSEHVTSYYFVIVTPWFLSCTVSEILQLYVCSCTPIRLLHPNFGFEGVPVAPDRPC